MADALALLKAAITSKSQGGSYVRNAAGSLKAAVEAVIGMLEESNIGFDESDKPVVSPLNE